MGSEMCIRDRVEGNTKGSVAEAGLTKVSITAIDRVNGLIALKPCLLYTSDAADERSSVDLGGRRIIKKKN